MLDIDKLEELLEKIRVKVLQANAFGELEDLLKQWGFEEFLQPDSVYETDKKGKIVVIGDSAVKESKLLGVIKELGLNPDRFEFCLDYNKAETYSYNKFKYNPNYRVVVFGPVPHSSTGKHYSSSVIAEMQSHEGYPRVEVLNANNAVKITKSNFKDMLENLISTNYISCA